MEINSIEISPSSCRICLQDGATYPIFEDSTTRLSIQSQLNKCFIEKIEDLEGYPRTICSSCKILLDMLCDFIDKYRESCDLLKKSLVNIKTETDNNFNNYDDDFDWEDEHKEIKIENNVEDNNIENSTVTGKLNAELDIKITKVKSQKCVKEINSRELKRKLKTRAIASSILENEFEWIGEKWCLKKESSKSKHKKPFKQKVKSIQKNITLLQKQSGKNTKDKDVAEVKKKSKMKEKPSILCDFCGIVFNEKGKLQGHIDVHHSNKTVTCKICSKTYPSEKRLKEHTMRFHGEMKLKCEYCTSMFATKSVLNSHIKSVHKKHLKPKKTYSCKYCNKEYKCPASIVVHERTVHTGVLPCVCKVCDKAFSHDMYLREHMRIHTGNLPFKCPICDRGCTQLSNMKSHLRIHKLSELNEDIMKRINPNYLKLLKNC